MSLRFAMNMLHYKAGFFPFPAPPENPLGEGVPFFRALWDAAVIFFQALSRKKESASSLALASGKGKDKKTRKKSAGKKGRSGLGETRDFPLESGAGLEEDSELESEGQEDEELEEFNPSEEGDLEEDLEEAEEEAESGWSSGSGKKDLELIERFLSGDEDAFAQLCMNYQHKVYNLCYRMLGDREEARDMAQEVFITLHKSIASFRGESLFSTWVFRVTVNHCKNRMKYLARRGYYQSLSIDQPHDTEEGELFFELEEEGADPEELAVSDQLQEIVQQAINTLDPDHKTVLLLRDIQELSYEEIAEIVGIKVGTVKSRIHRARNELKKKLAKKIKW